jgi:hypothetical protein
VDGSWISDGESCLEIAARPKPLSSSFVLVLLPNIRKTASCREISGFSCDMDGFTLESDTSGSGDLVDPVFRAQPEQAICKSRPVGTAKNYHSPGDAERPPNVRMTVDKDSRDSEPHTQRHTQAAIHLPQIQNRCHCASPFRRPRQKYYQFNGFGARCFRPRINHAGCPDGSLADEGMSPQRTSDNSRTGSLGF